MGLRILGRKAEVERKEDCAFYKDGFCMLDDRECVKVSRNAMRRYDGFSQRDYIELYWRRRERFQDLLMHAISLALSLAAVVISIVTFALNQDGSLHEGSKSGHVRTQAGDSKEIVRSDQRSGTASPGLP